jgi:hypothetical protein
MPVIPVLRKLRQEDLEFEASVGYKERPCYSNKRQMVIFSDLGCP